MAFEKETSNEIVVVIVNDFGGMEPAEFGAKLGAEWGVGQKETDNGAVLLVKTSEKRKVFISTGRGTETMLTDAITKDIVDNQIIPSFKSKDFYQGIDNGINGIISSLGGNALVPEVVPDATSNYSASENITTKEPTANTNYENQVTDLSKSEKDIYDTSEFQILLITFILGILIYLFGWLFFGIDAKLGKIVASESPPFDITPAQVSAINSMSYNSKDIFINTILSLAEKGYIKIRSHTSIVIIENNHEFSQINKPELIEEENFLYGYFQENRNKYDSKGFYDFPSKFNDEFQKLCNDLLTIFKKNNLNKYFRQNHSMLISGAVFHFISFIFFLMNYGNGWSFLYFIFLIGILILMRKLLLKLTKLGSQKKNQIEGFKLYLNTNKILSNVRDGENNLNLTKSFIYACAIQQDKNWFKNYKDIKQDELKLFYNVNNTISLKSVKKIITAMENNISRVITKPSEKKSFNSSSGWSSSDSWSSSYSSGSDFGGSDFGGGDFGGGGAGGDW